MVAPGLPAVDTSAGTHPPTPVFDLPPASTVDRPAIAQPAAAANGAPQPYDGSNGDRQACTAPQLRRFIKSRPWIPLHELRRRFAINGTEDDVTPVQVDGRMVFVGLPAHEGRLLGELLRGGEIGYELSLDPGAPIVIGVYPMRPVPRP